MPYTAPDLNPPKPTTDDGLMVPAPGSKEMYLFEYVR